MAGRRLRGHLGNDGFLTGHRDTDDTSDDIAIMVLEDFIKFLTINVFEIV